MNRKYKSIAIVLLIFKLLLQELFSICPEFMWDDLIVYTVETNSEGWVTLDGFLAYWA